MKFISDKKFALKLDSEDQLSSFREHFFIPENTIYVDGNSLGLLSKEAEESVLRIINEWKQLGINGWFKGRIPWWYFGEKLGALSAPLVGAKPEEIVSTGTTTVNLHQLIGTFFKPTKLKNKILADELNFPTDIYALRSQIRLKGLNPDEHLVLVPSHDGLTLNEKIIVEYMKDDIQLVVLPSALYRSGQLLDMEFLTQEAHKRGLIIGFDCSHSVGAVPHYLNNWDVDFAFWCSYKYMNSGPGSTAFLYLNEKHFNENPGLAGWFGYIKEKQFDMLLNFNHARSAGGWQISSSNILSAAPIEGALRLTLKAGIENIRAKSLKMTEYLMYLIDDFLAEDPYNYKIGTPREPSRRTGHVAVIHEDFAFEITQALSQRGIITDFRPPNIIRIAPTALYNTYYEIWEIAQQLMEIIDQKEYEEFRI